MITKEQFVNLITKYQVWDKRVEEVSDVLNCPIYDMDLVDYTNELFDQTIKISFDIHGVDNISWWLWEKAGNPELKMWDSDNNEIPTETIDDLWEIVKDERIQ